MPNLSKQIRVNSLLRPNAANGVGIVNDEDLRCWSQAKEGPGCDEALPTCTDDDDVKVLCGVA